MRYSKLRRPQFGILGSKIEPKEKLITKKIYLKDTDLANRRLYDMIGDGGILDELENHRYQWNISSPIQRALKITSK